jgi:hypothetical protein
MRLKPLVEVPKHSDANGFGHQKFPVKKAYPRETRGSAEKAEKSGGKIH